MNEWTVDAACADRYRVADVDANERRLREQLAEVSRPRGLSRLIGAEPGAGQR